MNKKQIVLMLSVFFLAACAGQAPGRLMRTQQPTAAELAQNSRSYKVYQLMDSALIYLEPGGKTILLDDYWKETTAPGSIGSRGPATPVFQITGHNGASFGYIIYTVGDSVGVTIVDPQTVRIYYSIPRKGGP